MYSHTHRQTEAPLNFHRLLAALSIAFFAIGGKAQVGVYGKFDAVRYSAASSSAIWYYGPGAGIYYDFAHLGPLGLGADLRGDLLAGSQSRYRSGLFGLRLAAKPPLLPIRPYVQASVGAGGARSTELRPAGITSEPYATKFQYQVLGGLDYTLIPHVDFRVAEIGYGRMTGVSSGAQVSATNLFNVSSGLVIRLH